MPSPFLAAAYLAAAQVVYWVLRVEVWRNKAPTLAALPANRDPLAPVALVLPVRNEARNVADCLATLLDQAESANVERIFVVDDGSTDDTAGIVERIAARNPLVTKIEAGPLAAGWRGKQHAVSRGVDSALAANPSAWILMTDADTRHRPDLLARALATCEERHLDSLSISGSQRARGLGENLVTPAMYFFLDALLGDWRPAADGKVALANGQFLLIHPRALAAIGGMESIKNAPLDDVALAERLHAAGTRHGFFRAQGLLAVRMYRGFRESFSGWRRILGTFLGKRTSRVALSLGLLLFPLAVQLVAGARGNGSVLFFLWLVGALGSIAARRGSGNTWAYGLLFPLDLLLVAICLVLGWNDHRRGEFASWKGRRMMLDE